MIRMKDMKLNTPYRIEDVAVPVALTCQECGDPAGIAYRYLPPGAKKSLDVALVVGYCLDCGEMLGMHAEKVLSDA